MSDIRVMLLILRNAAMIVVRRHRPDAVDGDLLAGCCSAMAMMVQGIAGGEILRGFVDGTQHFWNRLPDGSEVDLTSCQFGGDGWTPLVPALEAVERPELMDPIHLCFAMNVLAALSTPTPESHP